MSGPERELFGTDGVRGVAGEFLTAELAVRLGRAAALNLETDRPQVLIVRDTRESGPMLEAALASGIAAGGGDALLGGVLPTPAASILVRRLGLDLAAVVSASHNPYRDNGIKFFSADGTKLSDDAEAAIEQRLDDDGEESAGRVRPLEGALDDYLRELRSAFKLDLSGLKVVLDCANGATYRAAPAIYAALGAEVETICDEPDGRNINDGCGATHPEHLSERIGSTGAEIGFAFDGDGDRVIAFDSAGGIHNGDELIALAATHLSGKGRLAGGVVVTVMTNYGFHQAMGAAGIEVAQTQVGDRYVLKEMREREWSLGGEQSGHLIWTNYAPTGDGIGASLLTLTALGPRQLSEVEPFERLPQRLENLEVADRAAIEGASELWKAVEEENARLEGRGRVLVRPSGTEPLLRVMVEAPDDAECDAVLGRLVDLARRELA